jgi:hypothetical protein
VRRKDMWGTEGEIRKERSREEMRREETKVNGKRREEKRREEKRRRVYQATGGTPLSQLPVLLHVTSLTSEANNANPRHGKKLFTSTN